MSDHKKTFPVSDSSFTAEVLQSPELVLVDFWAEWCGPCRALSPVIDALAEQYEGKVKVSKLDIDANPSVPTAFQIRSIPTVMVFKNGKVVDRLIGAQPKEAFVQVLEKHLNSGAGI